MKDWVKWRADLHLAGVNSIRKRFRMVRWDQIRVSLVRMQFRLWACNERLGYRSCMSARWRCSDMKPSSKEEMCGDFDLLLDCKIQYRKVEKTIGRVRYYSVKPEQSGNERQSMHGNCENHGGKDCQREGKDFLNLQNNWDGFTSAINSWPYQRVPNHWYSLTM